MDTTALDHAFNEADQHLLPRISEAVMEWASAGQFSPLSITIALLKGSYGALAMHQNAGPELRQQAFGELSATIAAIVEGNIREFSHPDDNVVHFENWKAFQMRKKPTT